MDTLAKLAKKRKLATICRIGVWIIAIIGVVHIASQSYTLWQEYRQTPGGDIQNAQIYLPAPIIFLSYLPAILESSALYIFYCVILYCASVVFAALSAPAAESRVSDEPGKLDFDDESIVYTSLKPEEIRRDKKLNHQ